MQPRSYIWQMDALTYAISNTHLSTCSMSHTPQLRNLSLIVTFTLKLTNRPHPPRQVHTPPPDRRPSASWAVTARRPSAALAWFRGGHHWTLYCVRRWAGLRRGRGRGVCAMRSAVLRRRDDDTTGGTAVGGVGRQGMTDAGRTGNRTTGNRTDGRIGYVVEGIRSGRGRLKLAHAAWTRPGGHGLGSERR